MSSPRGAREAAEKRRREIAAGKTVKIPGHEGKVYVGSLAEQRYAGGVGRCPRGSRRAAPGEKCRPLSAFHPPGCPPASSPKGKMCTSAYRSQVKKSLRGRSPRSAGDDDDSSTSTSSTDSDVEVHRSRGMTKEQAWRRVFQLMDTKSLTEAEAKKQVKKEQKELRKEIVTTTIKAKSDATKTRKYVVGQLIWYPSSDMPLKVTKVGKEGQIEQVGLVDEDELPIVVDTIEDDVLTGLQEKYRRKVVEARTAHEKRMQEVADIKRLQADALRRKAAEASAMAERMTSSS